MREFTQWGKNILKAIQGRILAKQQPNDFSKDIRENSHMIVGIEGFPLFSVAVTTDTVNERLRFLIHFVYLQNSDGNNSHHPSEDTTKKTVPYREHCPHPNHGLIQSSV